MALDTIALTASGLGVALITIIASQYFFQKQRFPDVPTLVVSGTEADRKMYVEDVMQLLSVGWDKYSKHGLNYLLDLPKGKYFVAAPKYLDEILRAPPTHINAPDAQSLMTQTAYTISPPVANNQWHMNLPVRKNLMQATAPSIKTIVAEAKLYLNQALGQKKLQEVSAWDLSFDLVVRTANRVLFGPQLARDAEWKKVCVEYSEIMFQGADAIRYYPNFLKRQVLKWTTKLEEARTTAEKCLFPTIKTRLAERRSMVEQGRAEEWEKVKPSDAVQWVIDAAPADEQYPRALVNRLLHITTAVVHTTSFSFLETFHCLSLTPQYADELREEVVNVLRAEGGFTKQALTYMIKLDSYMTESSRWCPLSAYQVKLARLALRDWQLSDGTQIPKGTIMFLNELPMYLDESNYKNAAEFDPWRMYRRRQQDGEANKHQYVMTSSTHFHFGHGKHACPGRFFASNEMKVLLAQMLMRYDMQAKNIPGGLAEVGRGYWRNLSRVPITYAKVELKDRSAMIPPDIASYVLDAD